MKIARLFLFFLLLPQLAFPQPEMWSVQEHPKVFDYLPLETIEDQEPENKQVSEEILHQRDREAGLRFLHHFGKSCLLTLVKGFWPLVCFWAGLICIESMGKDPSEVFNIPLGFLSKNRSYQDYFLLTPNIVYTVLLSHFFHYGALRWCYFIGFYLGLRDVDSDYFPDSLLGCLNFLICSFLITLMRYSDDVRKIFPLFSSSKRDQVYSNILINSEIEEIRRRQSYRNQTILEIVGNFISLGKSEKFKSFSLIRGVPLELEFNIHRQFNNKNSYISTLFPILSETMNLDWGIECLKLLKLEGNPFYWKRFRSLNGPILVNLLESLGIPLRGCFESFISKLPDRPKTYKKLFQLVNAGLPEPLKRVSGCCEFSFEKDCLYRWTKEEGYHAFIPRTVAELSLFLEFKKSGIISSRSCVLPVKSFLRNHYKPSSSGLQKIKDFSIHDEDENERNADIQILRELSFFGAPVTCPVQSEKKVLSLKETILQGNALRAESLLPGILPEELLVEIRDSSYNYNVIGRARALLDSK